MAPRSQFLRGSDSLRPWTTAVRRGGVAPAIELELFHPFKSTKPAGLGLGLSICQTLIEAHGGRIGAGPHPAGGALFFFELPVSEAQALARVAS